MRRLLLAALATALAACGGGSDVESGPNGSTYTVVKGPLRITLTEKGTLRAKNSVKIRPKVKSPAKVVTLIDEGTVVEVGTVLAELDKAGYEKEVEDLEDRILQLDADLNSARTDVEIQVSDNSSAIQKAELEYELVQRDLERYEKGDQIQDERTRKLRVETAESDLQRAREKAKEIPELLAQGFITKLDAEEEELRIRKLETELETARLDLELWRKYTNPMELKRRRSKVVEAGRDLTRAQKLAESRLTAKSVVLKQKERRHAAAKAKLEESKEQLEHMTIKAPAPGIVVFSNGGRWDSEELKVGSTAYPNRTLMTLPDLSEMQVELEIHEADITKLKRGQEAIVTLESYKDLVLSGTVTKIATVGTSRGRWDSTKKFSVIVEVREKDLGLRPGISAKTEITIEEIPDTLSVPIQAIFANKGAFYAWVVEDGEPVRRPIKPAQSNDNFVQILEGLREADVVLLYDPETGEASGAPEEEGNGNGG